MGQEVNFTLLGRGDVYHSDENASTVTAIYRGDSGWQARGIAAAAADIRWPLVGKAFGGTQVLTPRMQLVAAHSTTNLNVPNEDARSVDLEDSNLFALNRFPGYDRIENNLRLTCALIGRCGPKISISISTSGKATACPIRQRFSQTAPDYRTKYPILSAEPISGSAIL